MSVTRRLFGAFGASILNPVVTVLIQLVNVPVMLRFWGPHLFGEWLLLSTIPMYILLTDLGFANVAGTDMTLRVHAADRDGAIETFQSIAVLVLGISLALGLALCAAVYLLPVNRLLHLTVMSAQTSRQVVLVLCVNCLIALQWGVLMAAYRCAGRYATGILYVNILRAAEGLSILVLAVGHAGPLQLALVMLCTTVTGTVLLITQLRRLVPWLPFGVRHFRWTRVRELANPAIAFMAFPVGGALSLQGTTLVVGLVAGPLAVAVFNPMRTLSRTVYQLTDAVKNSVWPELSAAYGQRNADLARRLHRAACQTSLWLAVPAALLLAAAGPRIFALWTHGRIVMDVRVFYFLLAAVLVNSTWNTSSVVPVAANRHQRLAVMYLAATSVSLLLAYVLTRHFALRGTAFALLLGDLAMSVYVVRVSSRLLDDHWPAFAASMLDTSQLSAMYARLRRRSS